jgi:predicted dehydrogenase
MSTSTNNNGTWFSMPRNVGKAAVKPAGARLEQRMKRGCGHTRGINAEISVQPRLIMFFRIPQSRHVLGPREHAILGDLNASQFRWRPSCVGKAMSFSPFHREVRNMQHKASSNDSPSRRDFHRLSASLTAAGVAAYDGLSLTRSAFAGAVDTIKVGLIGCGGRGTGAAKNALRADPGVRLTAVGDAFEDRLEIAVQSLSQIEDIATRVDLPKERQFVGFDAYQKVIDSGVDVVLLCTPPHFRPMHLKAAVAANKHAFVEKPVAVDAPGVRSVLATCEEARKRNRSIVSGLCLRYHNAFQEAARQIHSGAIGDVHTLQANDYRGPIWVRTRQPDWTDMHWQMRNWYYFTWLSGDFNVEQHIHFLDTAIWMFGNEYPIKAVGMGGRTVRDGKDHGNIYDHHSVVYEFKNGAKLFSNTRQMADCFTDLSVQVVGSKGRANLSERKKGVWIQGADPWTFTDETNDIYQTEHDDLFQSIRKGTAINHGEYMSKSTLLAIMGRMATYTGKSITWEMAMNSKQDLSPEKYEWGPLPSPEIARPGETEFA